MAGKINGLGANQAILDSIIKNANVRSDFSVIMAAKAIKVTKEQGAEAVKLINSASQIRTNRIDIRV